MQHPLWIKAENRFNANPCEETRKALLSCKDQLIRSLDDITAAIELIEGYPIYNLHLKVQMAASQCNEFVGGVVYGCGGWNRYFVYETKEGYKVVLSERHLPPDPLDHEYRIKASQLGIEVR